MIFLVAKQIWEVSENWLVSCSVNSSLEIRSEYLVSVGKFYRDHITMSLIPICVKLISKDKTYVPQAEIVLFSKYVDWRLLQGLRGFFLFLLFLMITTIWCFSIRVSEHKILRNFVFKLIFLYLNYYLRTS